MELYPPCVTCVVDNLLHIAEGVLPDPESRMELLRRVMERLLPEVRTGSCAPVLTGIGFDVLREMSGVDDPYEQVKREFNDLMLGLEDRFQQLVDSAEEPLHAALVAAGSANLIDFGAFREVSAEKVLEMMSRHLAETALDREGYGVFFEGLEREKELLILCDNCGEIVLDKVLIRVLRRRFPELKIACVVRGGPILNDATLEDAARVGLDSLCPVFSTGGRIPGYITGDSVPEFTQAFEESPLVLAKGVGNFECAPFEDDRMFFLFMVKCGTLSKALDLPTNTLVFMRGRGSLLKDSRS